MAIRTMPRHSIINPRFELQRVDAMSPENGGRIGGVQVGDPRWTLTFDLTAMREDRSEEWRAFITRHLVPGRRFYAFDPAWRGPRSGISASGIADWSFDLVEDDGDLIPTLELATGQPGYYARTGDYIGFRWETEGQPRRFVVRVQAPALADGSGSLITEVEPALPTWIPEDATVVLRDADCIMALTNETRIGEMSLIRHISASIVAVQEMLP